MHKVQSKDSFFIEGTGQIFVIESPVKSERNRTALLEAMPELEIDGKVYKTRAFETWCILSPVSIGEKLGVLVEEESDPSFEIEESTHYKFKRGREFWSTGFVYCPYIPDDL